MSGNEMEKMVKDDTCRFCGKAAHKPGHSDEEEECIFCSLGWAPWTHDHD